MTREIPIIQLGLGGVGRALARQMLSQSAALKARYDVRLLYLALVDSSGGLYLAEPLPHAIVSTALQAKQQGQRLADQTGGHTLGDWRDLLPTAPAIVADVTASGGVAADLATAVAARHRVALANKRPLTDSRKLFRSLTHAATTRYEATVGAGLPVISTLQNLLDSGDTITRIEASMSGTLGYLCTALEEGTPLSAAVRTAHQNGWTEPDPRDDLSGADVARKALILARTCGLEWDMSNVPAEALYPADMADLSVEEFLARLSEIDHATAERVAEARQRNRVLRYVANIEPQGASIGLREFAPEHPLAALRGTDNLFAFTTHRYAEQPLVVRGAGAGVEVTAAGVLGDIVALAREF